MPMWRCPHCGTPQAESSRCWVCRRSSTSCGTCRHFRRSIAGGLGYCGLDRRRQPLRGDEMHGCWETQPTVASGGSVGTTVAPRPGGATREQRRLDFVPLDNSLASRTAQTVALPAPEPPPAAPRTLDPVLGFWVEEG